MRFLAKNSGQEAKPFNVLGIRCLVIWSFLFIFAGTALPAHALTIVEKAKVTLAPGEEKSVFVSIKNQTSQTWQGGLSKTSLYLYGSSSPLKHSSWAKNDLPATIAQASVKPGQIATASFWVKAPSKPGTYVERFLLGNGSIWQNLTVIEISFVVGGQAATISSVPAVQPSVPTTGGRFANLTAYQASLVSKGGLDWQVNPVGNMTLSIKLRNDGKQTWRPSGTDIVSLYALSNDFKDTTWKGDYGSAALPGSIGPGGTATVTLSLKAPANPGQYKESFELRVNGLETITGSQFDLPIRVNGTAVTSAPATTQGTTSQTSSVAQTIKAVAGQYLAKLLLKPAGPFNVSGNDTLSLTYGIKNTGTSQWKNVSLKLMEVVPNLGSRLSSVRHDSWPTTVEAKSVNATINPGNLSLLDFKLKAPAKKGDYTVRFAMIADGQEVDGGEIDIPVTVTADGYIAPEPTTTPQSAGQSSASPSNDTNLPNEPIIRVGVYSTDDDTLVVRGFITGMNLTQGGSTVCSLGVGQEVTVKYDRTNGVYKASGSGCTSQSTQYYVAVAADGISPLEITDISRPVSWLPGANDNKFRSKLELRYTPKTNLVWVINELPVEYYLKGIAETSNVSPLEYQKALLAAARTYAMYHISHATKHADEYFIVDAKYDQVYRGYGQEARSPNIVNGVDATRGLIVTYDGKIAITPYFSRSDGRTRNWSDVWYGTVAWCVGVPVPQDAGKTLWGHGVGMSASGALAMANEGKTWDQILKYFYTGIALTRWYR